MRWRQQYKQEAAARRHPFTWAIWAIREKLSRIVRIFVIYSANIRNGSRHRPIPQHTPIELLGLRRIIPYARLMNDGLFTLASKRPRGRERRQFPAANWEFIIHRSGCVNRIFAAPAGDNPHLQSVRPKPGDRSSSAAAYETLIRSLPKLRPSSNPISACGACSRPMTTSSQYLMRPLLTHSAISR
jgi:hypothetical protein